MIRVALKLAYIGTDFYGFQRQPHLRTVEGELLKALKEAGIITDLAQSNYSIAGRTDRGVHALGNVVSFRTKKMPIINQINDLLPKDVRILGSARVPMGFKTRYAHRRHYRYVLCKNRRGEEWETHKMQQAAHLMEGTHNFINFSKRSRRNPIRNVESIIITPQKHLCTVDVIGESFLWNMVRKMVGVLLSVGKGDLSIDDVRKMMNPQNTAAITPLPPESLILMDVCYEGVHFKADEYARHRFSRALREVCHNHWRIVAATEEMINSLTGD
ncbi:MAG: tRNA pseudouridine(38-40) synthase TruA [Methanobacteriaceae archaeon]|nr:tRNA pseudouridine(38-40) synthase TruA [Methanobacteriaceae archaeon]